MEVGLAVERISDLRQVVVKSHQGGHGRVPGISAATVLVNGTIVLIVDPGLVIAS